MRSIMTDAWARVYLQSAHQRSGCFSTAHAGTDFCQTACCMPPSRATAIPKETEQLLLVQANSCGVQRHLTRHLPSGLQRMFLLRLLILQPPSQCMCITCY